MRTTVADGRISPQFAASSGGFGTADGAPVPMGHAQIATACLLSTVPGRPVACEVNPGSRVRQRAVACARSGSRRRLP
jgi:hypothetical protein